MKRGGMESCLLEVLSSVPMAMGDLAALGRAGVCRLRLYFWDEAPEQVARVILAYGKARKTGAAVDFSGMIKGKINKGTSGTRGRVMDDRVLKILGYDKIKDMLAACAVSGRGAAAAQELLPATDRSEAETLMAQTKEAESISIAGAAHPIVGFDDLSGELTRLKAGAGLSCAELLRVSRLLKAAKRAQKGIQKDDAGHLKLLPAMAENLFYDDLVIERIDTAILSEEEVADNASTALRDIRRKQLSENAFVREKLNSIIRSKEHASHLQDAIITMRNGRYVVPVKQEYRGSVPGLIHGQSASGATLFIEPMSIVEANNRLRVLEEEEQQEIERILLELSSLAGGIYLRDADRPRSSDVSRFGFC